jgi:hypothetical protein
MTHAPRWLLLIPVAWCVAVFAVVRPDGLKIREELAPAGWLGYDQTDLAALALRGANAHMGRLPGRRDEPGVDAGWKAEDLAADLDGPPAAYSERFYLEYPTPTLLLFRLPYSLNPDARGLVVPAVVADRFQYSVGQFVPRNDGERRVWGCLRFAVRFHVVLMAAALVALMCVLARGGGPVWLAALPAAVYFSLNRFDVLPALATALAFAGLGRNRPGWAGGWMAVGAILKVYPVLFVPVVLRHLGVRKGTRFLLGFGVPVVVAFGLSIALLDWEATAGPIRVQLARGLESSLSLYGRLLPESLARDGTARLGILAAVIAAATITRPANLVGVLRRCALILIVFVNLAVFWSPQWVVWFVPLLVPLAANRKWLIVPAVGLDVVNYLGFPVMSRIVGPHLREHGLAATADAVWVWLVWARIGLWFVLAAWLLWDAWAARKLREVTS